MRAYGSDHSLLHMARRDTHRINVPDGLRETKRQRPELFVCSDCIDIHCQHARLLRGVRWPGLPQQRVRGSLQRVALRVGRRQRGGRRAVAAGHSQAHGQGRRGAVAGLRRGGGGRQHARLYALFTAQLRA